MKSRWETTQKSLPVEVYLQWLEQRIAVHSYVTITSTYTQIRSLSTHCKFDTFYSFNEKTSEVENVMVHAP